MAENLGILLTTSFDKVYEYLTPFIKIDILPAQYSEENVNFVSGIKCEISTI